MSKDFRPSPADIKITFERMRYEDVPAQQMRFLPDFFA
jgi:hypothetical protein